MHLLINVKKWIEENKVYFLPPVCNKLMHNMQLKVMFVGGPNIRKDYHIEEGEELFYQVKGDMCLKIIENGKHKDVVIREGEMFLLPSCIPHSPQRYKDTVGLVIERRRLMTETDGLRYYIDNSTDVLFEKWFYCEDLGIQLKPVIEEFFSSQQHRTGKPNPDELLKESPFPFRTDTVMAPFSFKEWLDAHRAEIKAKNAVDMFGEQFETKTVIYGAGQNSHTQENADIWIWQLEGTSIVKVDDNSLNLSEGDSILISQGSKYQWERGEDCIALYIVQDPARKRLYP